MIRYASLHRRRDAQCLMDAAEIVVGVVDRNHVRVILELLGERIRQSRKTPDAHSTSARMRYLRLSGSISGGVETWHGDANEAPANERAGLG